MMVPTVHLNGTSREELVRQMLDAGNALREAVKKLEAMSPHPRDYYVQTNPNAHRVAMAEHRRRIELVHGVLNEVQALGEVIAG